MKVRWMVGRQETSGRPAGTRKIPRGEAAKIRVGGGQERSDNALILADPRPLS